MLERDFVGKEEAEVIASELFKKLMISKTLGGKRACATLTMPTDEACSHTWPLYVTAKFDEQLVYRVLVNNGATLNFLYAKKIG